MLNCLNNRVSEAGIQLNRKEKNLYTAWLNQAFDTTDLHTVDGRTLSVLRAGARNETEGPDFRDAMILIDGRFEQGDIELHLEATDWFRHKHDQDAHYNNVILHVVLGCKLSAPVKTKNGRIVPNLQILPFEAVPDIYACEHWEKVTFNDLQNVLSTFAEIRFKRKAQLFRELVLKHGPEQTFYEGLADVMGYSRNRIMFAHLTTQLPIQKIISVLTKTSPDQRIVVLESMLFGTAGFLTGPELKKFIQDTKYSEGLKQIWLKIAREYRLSEIRCQDWHFAGSRPANFPTLRIAALAQILGKFYPAEPAGVWISVLSSTDDYSKLKTWADEQFQQPDGLWRNHPLLKHQPGQVLIGAQRFNDLMSNLLLPFGWAIGSLDNNRILMEKSELLAEKVECRSVPGNIKTALSRLSISPAEVKRNYLVQGMIEFTRRYCDMNICKLCPLEKYAKK